MHELGVAFYVVRDVKEVALANQAEMVTGVTLEIGEVSGIVHEYLIDVWDWAKKKEPIMEEAEMTIETIPAVTWCDHCRREYPTVAHGKTCPHCGSGETWLKQGKEFLIKEIRVT